MNFEKISRLVSQDLVKVGLIKKHEILNISENKENFVYPVQFTDYKYELSKAISVVEKFNNLFSLGTGGEFNYSDSQIIFHKVMDLVKNLDSKESIENQVVKDYNNIVLNEKVKLGKYTVGDKESVYVNGKRFKS